VGRNELRARAPLLQRALEHMLTAQAWPQSRDAPARRADAISFRQQAIDAFTPTMRQRLDLERIYRRARPALPDTMSAAATTTRTLPGHPRRAPR
jgi:Domain of unknown function DUF29